MYVLVCRTVSQCSRCGEAKEGWQGFLLNLELTMLLLGWWSSGPQDCLSLPSSSPPPVIGTSSQAGSYVGYEESDSGAYVDQQALFPTISPRPDLEGSQQLKTWGYIFLSSKSHQSLKLSKEQNTCVPLESLFLTAMVALSDLTYHFCTLPLYPIFTTC